MNQFNKIKIIAKGILSLFCLVLLMGCTSNLTENDAPESSARPSAPKATTTLLDNSLKKEYSITTDEGSVISLPCGESSRIDISFPAMASSKDIMVELELLDDSLGEGFITGGFHLNETGKSGLELSVPTSICYVTSEELPENATFVKYSADGKGYIVVPCHRFKTTNANGLIAYVESFSAYGVKIVTDDELEEMANDMQKSGFNWMLEVDDRAGFTEEYFGEIPSSTTYEAYLTMALVNTESPSSFVMNGPYKGFAKMQSKAKVTIEGIPFGSSLVEAKDDSASFTLYPIFEQYIPELGSGLAPLSGLVPIGYEGEGVLHMKDPIDLGGIGGEDGINMMEVARQMESEWGLDLPGLQDENIPFTVVTDGPVAYVTLEVQGGQRSLTLVGYIVGYSKNQEPKIVPLITEEQKNKTPAPKTKTTQSQRTDGTIDYDIDGDGVTDFSLFPLGK